MSNLQGEKMASLFSYCLRYDDGAAPNPYWGVCTLVICKPAIRRTAQVGDWVVGTGSKYSPIGDMSGMIVYAMKITQKLTMREYDLFTQEELPEKIPQWLNRDPRRRLGDSIWDFSTDPARLRLGVHKENERKRDMSGRYALLSNHFYYFGDRALPLPDDLQGIVKQGQGHRRQTNAPYVKPFEGWLEGQELEPNKLYGRPQMNLFKESIEI